ncbi:hypothetical protein [Nitrobacter sp.]|uniref:hypothetical protein n=1 Tax=Nitrobacter sp. TaxID=29420 RepID=UPI00399D6623
MVVTPDAFKASLTNAEPPQGVSASLAALWWAANGDWNKAHVLVQSQVGAEAAWVHAYLHRLGGREIGNAAYWYRRADKPFAKGSSEEEWNQIVAELLGGAGG